jgi:hypothetical protein
MRDPRIQAYELQHGCRLLGPLGPGVGQDGFVQRSDRLSAVKFFDRIGRFDREVEVYRVLQSKGIVLIAGHNIPELLEVDASLVAIEITIVERPFLLDFAGAKHPSEVPDFEQHVWDEHYESLREMFGDRWTDALYVAAIFERETGFKYLDPHPGNIGFADP